VSEADPSPRNVVANPILNVPFREPTRYYDFSGASPRIQDGRRRAEYFGTLRTEHVGEATGRPDAIELRLVNEVRARVADWRKRRYPGVTPTTRDLLDHWNRSERRPLFFCQREAAETLIWLVEGTPADRQGIEVPLDAPNDQESARKAYGALRRYCAKMATGSGKTLVMAMVAAWSILNKIAQRQDARFADAVLVVGPNLTVKERLAVLDPNRADNYYDAFDLVPRGYRDLLASGRVFVTNWHAFAVQDDSTRRGVVQRGRESDAAFAKRVLGKDLGTSKELLVLNDEAHHAYRPAPPKDEDDARHPQLALSADERKEAQSFAEEATVWIGGLDRIHKARGIKMVFDVSATPFYVKGTGYPEGTPLPWIVSDFSLVDAIESGITKVPRIPVADDSGRPDPKYFHLWREIMAKLPQSERESIKRRAKPESVWKEAQGAFATLAAKWQETFEYFEEYRQPVPPVLIVVAANTTLSQIVTESVKKGDTFEALKGDYTFGIDSRVLADAEAGDAGGSVDREKERLRLKTATVGKATWPGDRPPEGWEDLLEPPGKNVRCVVSVGMLTEGWDAQNVTQILGLRAFGSQLLCEQVVGRGLRRMSYEPDPATGRLAPEYCDVFGIPFEAIPVQGMRPPGQQPLPPSTLVRALDDRRNLEITWPRVEGYIRDVKSRVACDVAALPPLKINPQVEPASVMVKTVVGWTVGKKGMSGGVGNLETLTRERFHDEHRLQKTAFEIARDITDMFAARRRRPGDPAPKPSTTQRMLFPQILNIVQEFLDTRVEASGLAEVEDVALAQYRSIVIERLAAAIVPADTDGVAMLLPRLEAHRGMGTTDGVQFRTTKPTRETKKSHVSHVVQDSTWEGSAAFHLENDPSVVSYAKNDRLDFEISYDWKDQRHAYTPDFLVIVDIGEGRRVTLILEIKGQEDEQDRQKQAAALNWVSAVNNHRGLGVWAYGICRGANDLPTDLARWRAEWTAGANASWRPPPPASTRAGAKPASAPPSTRGPGKDVSPRSETASPDRRVGDYVILGTISGGGMADCFRARAPTGETVFVKRARIGSGDDDALQRESDIYGRLQYSDCKHVLAVRDLHRDDGYVSLVTEFADGGDLKHFVEGRGKAGLPLRDAIPIATEIALGLGELHDAEIVHRDLKPENVLLVGTTWKLADFGIAKNVANVQPGKTFLQSGTLGYAPPEQFEGEQANATMDVYSFGKLLAFLVTGATDPDKISLGSADWRRLAFKCAQDIPERRPRIDVVVDALRKMSGDA
jgi:type III restriction enzyme